MIGLKRRRRISLKMAARHCVSLTKVSHEASSQKFISVKSSLSLLKERLLPVSPKVRAEHCDQHLILRFTKQLKLKKEQRRLARVSSEDVASSSSRLSFSSLHPH